MEHSADGAPPLVAAPRHLRRRRLHEEIPDTLLVPGAEPLPLPRPRQRVHRRPEHRRTGSTSRGQAGRRTDATDEEHGLPAANAWLALLAVLFVVVSVPAIVLALLLLG